MWHWGTHSLNSFRLEPSYQTTASKTWNINLTFVFPSLPLSPPLLGKFSSYKSKLNLHLIFIESFRPWWKLNISSQWKIFHFLEIQSAKLMYWEIRGPAIISAQWCIMIIHYEPNIKTCPSPVRCNAQRATVDWILLWHGVGSLVLTGDDGNMQQKWKVANDKASIILVLTWKFLLKFQENVNELLKPKPAPSWRRGMREKIWPRETGRGLLQFYHRRREREGRELN